MTNPKGYGFLKVEGEDKDIFFHVKDLRGVEFTSLKSGDKVVLDRVEVNPVTGKKIAREITIA